MRKKYAQKLGVFFATLRAGAFRRSRRGRRDDAAPPVRGPATGDKIFLPARPGFGVAQARLRGFAQTFRQVSRASNARREAGA
ncbi:hypothetical protein [Pseudoxanthomonas mexicana]|uniref:hypothetical protein n=1 Tax=Pseudoxanthomonas mexicana TaxID=128785 RepID=UPI00398AA334